MMSPSVTPQSVCRAVLVRCVAILVGLACLAVTASPVSALSRIKDLAQVEGVRQNNLVGYGLVVGLNGTGDTLNNAPFTKQSLTAMLERLGVNTRGATLRTANVAAVMVTASFPAFASQGTRLDVTVSALGDSKSLQGGTLLVTPLLGADGEVYAVAQGSVAIAGFQAEGEAAKVTRGVPTVGRIANGALTEREIEFKLNTQRALRLALRNPDLTTAKRIAASINDFLGADTAEPTDPSTINIQIPAKYRGNMVQLLTEIEQLRVEPDQTARIVIDERSGIIVMGRDVRVSQVAVAQGNLTVTISERPEVSQPNVPFTHGTTHGGAAHERQGRYRRQEQARARRGRRVAARARGRPQRPRHRAARPHLHPAGDQVRRRAPGRNRGDVMVAPLALLGLGAATKIAGGLVDAVTSAAGAKAAPGKPGNHDKLRKTADDFESVFLEQTVDRLTQNGGEDGPLGEAGAGGSVYRSMLSKEYAGSIVRSGGVGISDQVYRQLLQLQAGGAGGG